MLPDQVVRIVAAIVVQAGCAPLDIVVEIPVVVTVVPVLDHAVGLAWP